MVFKAADRVQEISATTGTGPYVVSGSPSGFQTWLAGLGNGNSAYYAATDDTQWEVGETVLTGGNTLTRTVLVSSNANAPVNWGAGAKKVFLDYPAVRAVFVTPTGKLNVDISALQGTAGQFNAALTDADFVFQYGLANLSNIITGAGISTGDVSIELGQLRTGSGATYIDFHSTPGTDFEGRLMRVAGADGGFELTNKGLGVLSITQGGAAPILFQTANFERMRVDGNGRVGIGTYAPTAHLHVAGADSDIRFGLSALSKGLRVIVKAEGTTIDGVDNTLVASYQPLFLGGSTTDIQTYGETRMRVSQAAGIQTWGGIANYGGYFEFNTAPGITRGHWYKSNSMDRWVAGVGTEAETGGNVGSTYFINRYADNGAYLGTPFSIARDSGQVTTSTLYVAGTLTVNGTLGVTSSIRTYQPGGGNVGLTPGGGANSGYVEFWRPDGVRVGYIGHIPAAGGYLSYQNESGGRHYFGQTVEVGGNEVWVGGNTLMVQGIPGNGSYIRSYVGPLNLGYGNVNNVNIGSAGLTVTAGSGIFDGDMNQLLLHPAGANCPTIMMRNDSANFYMLLTDPSIYANGTFNALRPFTLNLTTGGVSMAHGLDVNAGGLRVTGDISTAANIHGGGMYANYFQSAGEIRSVNGFFNCTGTGNVVGLRAVNNNIGHDYRLIAKDSGNFAVTNESLGIEYMAFDVAGNIHTSRDLHLDAAVYSNATVRISSGGGIGWGNAWANLECFNADTSGGGFAGLKMHRPGQFGVYYGLDYDNCVRLGGWSAPIMTTVDTAGNFTAAGNVAAYSDERLKENWREVAPDYVAKLAEVKHGIFDRIDSKETQVGVSAQSLQKLLPEAVGECNDYLNVNYGGAAMLSAVELAKMVVALEKRVAELEAKLGGS